MNEENNYDINFENENNIGNVIPDDVVIPGNIIGADDDIIGNNVDDNQGPIIVNTDDSDKTDELSGPIIVSTNDSSETEELSGPIIVNSEEEEKQAIEKIKTEELSLTFKELENEIKDLNNEKEEVEKNIESLNKRKNELEILIKSKQEELDYKKEVEVTTDKLKTYIRDLEVKPGAVRDALAALINNMDN